MAEPIVHEQVRCPRCAARGMRELTRLPEEGHPLFICPFCRHMWCERGRIRTYPAPCRRNGRSAHVPHPSRCEGRRPSNEANDVRTGYRVRGAGRAAARSVARVELRRARVGGASRLQRRGRSAGTSGSPRAFAGNDVPFYLLALTRERGAASLARKKSATKERQHDEHHPQHWRGRDGERRARHHRDRSRGGEVGRGAGRRGTARGYAARHRRSQRARRTVHALAGGHPRRGRPRAVRVRHPRHRRRGQRPAPAWCVHRLLGRTDAQRLRDREPEHRRKPGRLRMRLRRLRLRRSGGCGSGGCGGH